MQEGSSRARVWDGAWQPGQGWGALGSPAHGGRTHAGIGGSHSTKLLLKPLRWEMMLFEQRFFSASYTSSALSFWSHSDL